MDRHVKCAAQSKHITDTLLGTALEVGPAADAEGVLARLVDRLQQPVFFKSYMDGRGLGSAHFVKIHVTDAEVARNVTFEQLRPFHAPPPDPPIGYNTFATFASVDGTIMSAGMRWIDALAQH